MSSEAQPRRRKDKRKKKDDSEEPIPVKSTRPSPPPASNFTEGDSIIHVDHDHGTGGHWCAKIVFFVLLGVLVTLIGLILIENRGLTDLDTPVSESRFAQVFDGWVDEGPIHDDHHDEHTLELNHDDDDDDHDDHDDELSDGHDDEVEDIESEVGESDDEHDDHDDDDDVEADDDHDENEVDDDQNEEGDDDDDDEDGSNPNGDDDDDAGSNPNDDDDDGDDDDGGEDSVEDIHGSVEDRDEGDEMDEVDEPDLDDDDDDGDDDDDDDVPRSNEDDDDDDNQSEENMGNDSHEMEGDDDDEEQLDDDIDDFASDEDIERNLPVSAEDDFDSFQADTPLEEVGGVEEDVVDNTAGEEELLAAKRAEAEEESDSMGLRVGVGLALVTVTYCVLARKWRNVSEFTDDVELELNRRMTLIPDDESAQSSEGEGDESEPAEEVEEVAPVRRDVPRQAQQQQQPQQPTSIFGRRPEPVVRRFDEDDIEEVIQPVIAKNVAREPEPEEEDEDIEEIGDDDEEEVIEIEIEIEDDEDIEYEEEDEEYVDNPVIVQKEVKIEPVKSEPVKSVPAPAQDDEEEIEEVEDEEVEDEEVIEEEDEEVEDEEDMSEEIDDSELMRKLEAKYGKLPEPDDEAEGQSDDDKPVAPARKRAKPTGGNSAEDEWINWKNQLDLAQAEMDEGRIEDAYRHFTALTLTQPKCWRSKLGRARALDALADKQANNQLLQSAIDAYTELLNMTVDDEVYRSTADRLINRLRFKGSHLNAVPVHKALIEKYPSDPDLRNQLAITYLMVNKIEMSRRVLLETLKLWPNDGVALVHYGFILKTSDNNLKEAVDYLKRGVDTAENGTRDGRFLFHLGDALARLGRNDDALKIYELGADLKVFLSPMQRSLYNVDRLTGNPWWKPEKTPYGKLVKDLEANWKQIAEEARRLRKDFISEQENLKDTGDWTQYELFVRGRENKEHCAKCPITCGIVRMESAASGCRRGQIKFSAMSPGTHVFAHTGPTNCRIRAHLGLFGTKGTYIRVASEIRSWEEGKVFIFDDSFEHEVWHNGTSLRIVLIVDLWHPELTLQERKSLPAI